MKPCLSQATTMPCGFTDDVNNSADAGCPALEVWLTKLEEHLQSTSIDATRDLLKHRNVELVAAAYQGGLLLSEGESKRAHYDHFLKRLDLCQQFNIRTLLLAPDFMPKIEPIHLDRGCAGLAEAAQWAAGFGVTLALEFRARDSFCTSLDTALALVHQCGEPNVGINLDVFHWYTGPSKFDDFSLLTPDRLAHVQLCDLAGVPRELATDADRILPGDGDFQLQPIIDMLRRLAYDRWVSVEVLNPTLWRANSGQVAEIAYTSLRKALGLSTTATVWSAHPV